MDTAPITFSLTELWVLQGAVRHGVPSEESQWPRFPPASLSLNDDIADAIAACDAASLSDYTLLLTRGDLLVIDHCVGQATKDSSGRIAGRDILLKSFHARRRLRYGDEESSEEPDITGYREQIVAFLETVDES